MHRWWWHRLDELVKLAPANAPVYVYDLSTVARQAALLTGENACDRTFFAVKVPFPDQSLKFECMIEWEFLSLIRGPFFLIF